MSDLVSLDIQSSQPARTNSSKIGQTGEALAAAYIDKTGYRLVAANFKVPIGRNRVGAVVSGEIDLIAYERGVLCFIEVKTRSSDRFASPLAAVDLRKQRQITRTAKIYRKIFRLADINFRYDVVSIILKNDKPEIELFRNFWTENKFAKKNWRDDF